MSQPRLTTRAAPRHAWTPHSSTLRHGSSAPSARRATGRSARQLAGVSSSTARWRDINQALRHVGLIPTGDSVITARLVAGQPADKVHSVVAVKGLHSRSVTHDSCLRNTCVSPALRGVRLEQHTKIRLILSAQVNMKAGGPCTCARNIQEPHGQVRHGPVEAGECPVRYCCGTGGRCWAS